MEATLKIRGSLRGIRRASTTTHTSETNNDVAERVIKFHFPIGVQVVAFTVEDEEKRDTDGLGTSKQSVKETKG